MHGVGASQGALHRWGSGMEGRVSVQKGRADGEGAAPDSHLRRGIQKLPYRLPHTVHCGLGAPQGAVQGAVQGTSREGTIGCSESGQQRGGCWDVKAEGQCKREGQMGREHHHTVTSEGVLEAALQAASYGALGLVHHRGQYRGQYRGLL